LNRACPDALALQQQMAEELIAHKQRNLRTSWIPTDQRPRVRRSEETPRLACGRGLLAKEGTHAG
jgi:hypothetical protein